MTWCKLLYNHRELQLLGTLNGGQSFRWSHNKETDEWTGVFSKTVWKLRQKDDSLQYKVVGTLLNTSTKTGKKRKNGECFDTNNDVFKKLLEQYFRLDVKLSELYEEWAEKDELFRSAGQQFYGIRMLRQEPVENLFSFICSQNNHISRISGMVEKLCSHYGEEICQHDGVTYFAFPEVEKLSNPKVESELRVLGFGYRAKFIQKSAEQILTAGREEWFRSLQNMKYLQARSELMTLHGIGPKVADCICLMSLNHLSAVPVDTHVYQIAAQHYLKHLRGKKSVTGPLKRVLKDAGIDCSPGSVRSAVASSSWLDNTPIEKILARESMYREIGDHFRNLYGDLAGWAHTVLFCADLKKFQNGENDTGGATKSKRKRKC